MIVLDKVHKRYAHPEKGQWFNAVNPTSLTINQGEIFGLIGYSGAGKSTLLRLINLLERPDGGEVIVDGNNLTQLSSNGLRKARQNIGMIFQQFNLLSNLTVADNIAFPLKIAGWSRSKIQARIKECLSIVDLEDRINHYPAQLSGGQKQRVGIARALAPSPHVILADEPTSALDPYTTRSVLECLSDINKKFNVTIVIVTHEMHVIRSICHRAALMEEGNVVEIAEISNKQILAHSALAKKLIEEI